MTTGQPRTGTIPVPLVLEREFPWKKIALSSIVSLGFLLILSLATRPTIPASREERVAELEHKDRQVAIDLAQAELQRVMEAARHWHEYLARKLKESGRKEQAYQHYLWLTRNYPADPKYKKGLADTAPKKKSSAAKKGSS